MKIAVVDYGAGNLKSVSKALCYIGEDVCVTSQKDQIRNCGAVVLPGVGAFPDAVRSLKRAELFDFLKEEADNKPFLGICLGMQLLFETGLEFETCEGLGLIPGTVEKLSFSAGLKIPHMGWNSLHLEHGGRLFDQVSEQSYVYFVHSYYLKAGEEEIVKASTEYGVHIHASVEKGNVFACQFHPEKSSEVGLRILSNFVNI